MFRNPLVPCLLLPPRAVMVAIHAGCALCGCRLIRYVRQARRAALVGTIRSLLASEAVVAAIVTNIDRAIDHHAVDFVTSRLPLRCVQPPREETTGVGRGCAAPQAEAATARAASGGAAGIRLVDPSSTRLVAEQPLVAYRSAQVVQDAGSIALYHSLLNDPADHMDGGTAAAEGGSEDEEREEEDGEDEDDEDDEDNEDEGREGILRFSWAMLPALQELYAAWPGFVEVEELAGLCSGEGAAEACRAMARGLELEGLVELR